MISLLNKASAAICLRGFTATELEKASKFLTSRGHRVVRSLNAAQCVVAGPDADNSLLENSRVKGLKVVTWNSIQEEIREGGALATMVAPDEVPLAEETVHPLLRFDHGIRYLLDSAMPAEFLGGEADRKYVPQAERFAGLCFDQPFVETLQIGRAHV